MRNRGQIAAAGAAVFALLLFLSLRERPAPAPEPESESTIPAEGIEPPPQVERMPTLFARPRLPSRVALEVEALIHDPAANPPAGGAGPAAGSVRPAVDPAALAAAADALPPPSPPRPLADLLPDPRDDDPPWPLFTEDEVGRRHALRRGGRALARLGRLHTDAAVWAADRIRRDLTEGIFLPESADPVFRGRLEAQIAELNEIVYRYPRAMPGVTEIVVAARGDYPYRLVERRPFGSNTILFWNRRGSLDPRRMPANEPLVVPLEPLTLIVDRETRALFLLLGDAFIREFRIGVGAERTPTPTGRFAIGDRIDRRTRNQAEPLGPMGSAWMGTWEVTFRGGKPDCGDRGPSLHGTDRPESIGYAESDGSIRLANRDASELLRWLDTRYGGPLRLYVR